MTIDNYFHFEGGIETIEIKEEGRIYQIPEERTNCYQEQREIPYTEH